MAHKVKGGGAQRPKSCSPPSGDSKIQGGGGRGHIPTQVVHNVVKGQRLGSEKKSG